MAASRHSLLRAAILLSLLTIGWNGVVGLGALVLAIAAGSAVTTGFALGALLDSSASAMLVWRFRQEQRAPHAGERLERQAQRLIVVAMLGVACFVALRAIHALLNGTHAGTPDLAVMLAALSLVFLPWLGNRKLTVASALPSPALRGDAVLTLAAAVLAGVTLIALLVDETLGWWWADPVAALIIATALVTEAVRIGVRHAIG